MPCALAGSHHSAVESTPRGAHQNLHRWVVSLPSGEADSGGSSQDLLMCATGIAGSVEHRKPHLRRSARLAAPCSGHGYDVRDVAVSADNSKFASAGGDRQLFLWDVATGQTIRKFAGHDGVINSVRR